jgi:5-methyltetrahydrofolate--homocysteine methyltransferase
MRGPADLAEAVLGPELMCLSMYDSPDALRRFLDQATDAFITIVRAQLNSIPPLAGGYVNPFGVWAPGRIVRTQCDASAFLSPQQYAEWFLPYDQRISESVDYAIIHLHSVSLHTVGPLLTTERPQAIQITLETSANAPTLEEMVPIFRQILARKPLLIDGPLSQPQVRYLRRELPQDGLYIRVRQADW